MPSGPRQYRRRDGAQGGQPVITVGARAYLIPVYSSRRFER